MSSSSRLRSMAFLLATSAALTLARLPSSTLNSSLKSETRSPISDTLGWLRAYASFHSATSFTTFSSFVTNFLVG